MFRRISAVPIAVFLAMLVCHQPSPVSVEAQAPKPQPQKVDYGRGRKVDLIKLKAAFDRLHAFHLPALKALPRITASSYDARTLGIIPPIRNQGQCGSCWDFSGSGMVTVALVKAGQIPNSTNEISEQATLDCYQNGGCNGDDNTTVLAHAKATGLPLDSDYGEQYQGRAGQCKSTSATKLYTIKDWGFCTTGGNEQSVASVQDIKNALVAYGCVGTGVAAGSGSFWNSGIGTDVGTSTDIDHDVIIVGWDDNHDNGDGSKGAWIMRNSWDVTWGVQGYGWVKYGADGIGTEAVWCVAVGSPPAPGPGPGPAPPGPTPPVPPVPGQAPSINSATVDSTVLGAAYSYQITATNSPTSFVANFLPAGLTCSPVGLISGSTTAAGVYYIGLAVENSSGAAQAALTLTVTSTPGPVSPVSLTLTKDQVASVVAQSGIAEQLHVAIDNMIKPSQKPGPSHQSGKADTWPLETRVESLEKQLNDIGGGLNLLMHKLDKLDTYFGIDGKPAKDVPAPAKKTVSFNHGGTFNVSTLNDSEYRGTAFSAKPSDRTAADFPGPNATVVRPAGQDRGEGRCAGSDQAGFGDYWTNNR